MPGPAPSTARTTTRGEIAGVAEVAPRRRHEAALSLRQPLIEDRQRAGHVARADDVGEPKRHPVDAGKLHVMLARRLRDRIARVDGIDRMIERDRRLQRLGAVAERGLEIDQPRHAVRLARLGDIGSADRVHQRVGVPVVRILVGRGGVHHDVGLKFAKQLVRPRRRRRWCPRPP